MKKLFLSALALLCSCSAKSPEPIPQNFVPGEFIIDTSKAGPLFNARSSLQPSGGPTLVRLTGLNLRSTVETDLCELPMYEGVPCSRNFLVNAHSSNDPMLSSQWGIENSRAFVGADGVQRHAVKVAVIDSGIDSDHPDLSPEMLFDAIENVPGQAEDENGHGTHVAGIICGKVGNGIQIAGAFGKCSLMVSKFLDARGGGTLYNAIRAIDWAVQNGAQIINASWGCTNCYSEPLERAIERARDSNVLFVAAAGNDGKNNDNTSHYPSNYELDNVVSVASIGRQNRKSTFSNYGAGSVHIGAPGENIESTYLRGRTASLSGTSMAAPFVSAALAESISRGTPGEHYSAHKERLLRNARKYELPVISRGTIDIAGMFEQEPDPTPSPPATCRGGVKGCKSRCDGAHPCECKKLRKCKKNCKKKCR